MNSKPSQNKFTNRITNPNFIKTPPHHNSQNKAVINSTSVNVHSSKIIMQKVKSARLTSIINLANLNLEVLPSEIFEDNIKLEDVNWWEMVDIKKLDASNNKLTSDSFEKNSHIYNFNSIPSLNFIKFSFNLLTTIPETIHNLIYLKYLDFSNNKITNLNSEIKNLKALVELNLSNNLLTKLPDEIGFLKELEIINFSFNKITQITKMIGNLSKLKRMDFSENLITQIPLEINNLIFLEELILFKNKIFCDYNSEFSLEGLSNLKYLDLHNNIFSVLKNLPYSEKLDTIIVGYNKLEKIENLNNAPNLSVLDVNNNKIENFPEEILNLKELKTLNFMNNSLNDIPPQICFLKELVRINLEGNPLKKINSKVRSSNAENLKSYLKTRLREEDLKDLTEDKLMEVDSIDINSNSNIKSNMSSKNNFIVNYLHNNSLQVNNLNLEEIPFDQMKKCLNLNFLFSIDFSNNKIISLEGFEIFLNNLDELKEFKLSQNKIENFPNFMINFYNLKIIDLKSNFLFSFLDNIAEEFEIRNNNSSNNNFNVFPTLEYLDLSINKFKSIPLIMKYLTNLNVFLISNNIITNISNLYLTQYNNLDTLDLGTNKIENLKEKSYRYFPSLKNINLENNEIKTIPTDLCVLNNLNKLNLNGNPIKMLRSNIINGGSKVILDYLRKMHKFDQEDFIFEKKNNFQTSNIGNVVKNNKIEEDHNDNDNNTIKKFRSELDEVNDEILEVEKELASNPSMAMFKKTDLKKKLHSLIRLRANLMKEK